MKLNLSDIKDYVESNIGDFHDRKLQSLVKLKLKDILKRKNPYLFKAKAFYDAHDLIKSILDAHLSSQEETIFGEFLEGLAIYICSKEYSGMKSASSGIDLEFERDEVHYLVSIKSGPNWGNSRQIAKMIDDFKRATKILKTSGANIKVEAINGCCYGKDDHPEKSEYKKLCGQRFWEFISGNTHLYTEIIEPLGYRAKENNEQFLQSYGQVITRFTVEFANEFCTNGAINWNKLVEFNSGRAG